MGYITALLLPHLLVFGLRAYATTEKPDLHQLYGCTQPIKAALFESGLLYSEESDSGSSKDLLELLARESTCEIQQKSKPRARIWMEIKNGYTDMTINGLINDERKEFAGFAPYMSGKNLVIVKKELGKVADFAALEKMPGVYIGVVRTYKHGYDIDAFIDKMKTLGRVKQYTNDKVLSQAFAAGAVSVMFQQGLTYEKILSDNSLEDKVNVLDFETKPMAGAVVLAKKRFSDDQILAWQKLVQRLRHEGKIKKTFRRFFSEKICQQYIL